MHRRQLVGLALSVAALACAEQASAVTNFLSGSASTSWGNVIGYHPSFIGRDLNGTGLNGTILDGRIAEAVAFAGATKDGQALRDVRLDGAELVARDGRGKLLKGERFVGVTMQATLDDGAPLPVYVVATARHPAPESHDVWGYEVWFAGAAGWQPLCGLDDDGLPIMAIPLAGRWSYESGVADGGAHFDDPAVFTFGCESHVLAKCVVAGYHPWEEALVCARGAGCSRRSLAPLHQACTRALRADYCGDGTSHTVDGTVVNLYDGFDIRLDSEGWTLESVWDADGALCLDSPRINGEPVECADASSLEPCALQSLTDDPMLVATEIS